MRRYRRLRESADDDNGFVQSVITGDDTSRLEELLDGGRLDVDDAVYGDPLLNIAARLGSVRCARLLLDRGADPDRRGASHAETPLMQAVEYGRAPMVELLLKAGADVNARTGNSGETAVFFIGNAVRFIKGEGGTGTARALLSAPGVDVDARNDNGWTALQNAARTRNAKTVKMLLDAGADPDTVADDGLTPLLRLTRCDYSTDEFGPAVVKTADALLKGGADANARDRLGNDALMLLATRSRNADTEHERERAKTSLLRHLCGKVALNHRNKAGRTALHIAAAARDPERVEILLTAGADPDARDNEGDTPITATLRSGSTIPAYKTIKTLVDGGADPSAANAAGVARETRNTRCLKLLAKSGAALNESDRRLHSVYSQDFNHMGLGARGRLSDHGSRGEAEAELRRLVHQLGSKVEYGDDGAPYVAQRNGLSSTRYGIYDWQPYGKDTVEDIASSIMNQIDDLAYELSESGEPTAEDAEVHFGRVGSANLAGELAAGRDEDGYPHPSRGFIHLTCLGRYDMDDYAEPTPDEIDEIFNELCRRCKEANPILREKLDFLADLGEPF